MKTNKKISMSLLVSILMVAFFAPTSTGRAAVNFEDQVSAPADGKTRASSPARALANVGIVNIEQRGQTGNVVKLAFDIDNGESVQSQIKYSVRLVKVDSKGGQYLIDEKVYDETLSMSQGELVHREVEYNAPKFLQGKYELWMRVGNQSGLLMGTNKAGNVELMGTGSYIEITPETCFLTVEGEGGDKKYFLDQGVDVSKEETVVLHCLAKSHFQEAISATPNFDSYWRLSASGKKLNSQQADPIQFLPGGEIEIALAIPKEKKPQAYDSVLVLRDANDVVISNSINAHYVVQGVSATIKNLRVDKNYYTKDETAKISFDWMPSADGFGGARGNNQANQQAVNMEILISGDNIANCGVFKKQLTVDELSVDVNVSIVENCHNPKVLVTLRDLQGVSLDEGVFQVQSEKSQDIIPATPQKSEAAKMTLFGFAGLVALFGGVAYLFQRRSKKMLTLLLIVSFAMFVGSKAEAASSTAFNLHGHYCHGACDPVYQINYAYSASLDKALYAPGETVTVTGTASDGYCSNNGTNKYQLMLSLPVAKTIVNTYGTDYSITNSVTFTAPAVPGAYNAQIYGCGYGVYGDGWCSTEHSGNSESSRQTENLQYGVVNMPTVTPHCHGAASVVDISWPSLPAASGYSLNVNPDSETNWSGNVWGWNNGTVTSLSIDENLPIPWGLTTLTYGRQYPVRVLYQGIGWGPTTYFTAKNCTLPTSSIGASSTSILPNQSVTINWNSSSPAGYGTDCWVWGRYVDNGAAVTDFPDAAYGGGVRSKTINLDRSANFYASCWDWTGTEARNPIPNPVSVTVNMNFSCNPVPANPDPQGKATPVTGDTTNLPSDNISKTLVLSNTVAKCEYMCNSPYAYYSQGCSGSACCLTPASCAGCGSWSACSQPCGGGTQTRTCSTPDTTNTCAGSTEVQNCNAQACPTGYREVTP